MLRYSCEGHNKWESVLINAVDGLFVECGHSGMIIIIIKYLLTEREPVVYTRGRRNVHKKKKKSLG